MRRIDLLLVAVVLLKSLNAQEEIITVEAVVGQSTELPCNVTAENEGDVLRIIAWYRDGSPTAFYSSRDLRGNNSDVLSPGGRYKLITSEDETEERLQILAVRPSDAGQYYCFADFESSRSHKTYITLEVIEPPLRLWVIHENGTRVTTASAGANTSRNLGPYYIGDTVHLFCVVFGGKPLSSLSWWAGSRLLKNTTTPLSEQRVRGDLLYGPLRREDHGRLLTCLANNNDRTPPLSIDITIDMYLPPELVMMRVSGEKGEVVSSGRVRAGRPLRAQCRVLGARPSPPVIWCLNSSQIHNIDQNITREPSQRLLVSEVELVVSAQHDEALLTCCAPDSARTASRLICAQPLPLTVLYPPQLKIVVEGELENNTLTAVKGTNLTINCSYEANPSVYEITWFHGNDLVNQKYDQDESSMKQTLELREISESDSGEYVCAATNNEGSAYSNPIVIDVTYPAYCEDETIAEYGVAEDDSINITCSVKSNPAPSAYRWAFISETMDANKRRNNQTYNDETEMYDQDESSMKPTLELREISESDSGEYVCAATNNEGSAYSNPIVIDVTYPAYCEDETIAEYGVAEDDSINITCSVKSNPAPSVYRWAFISETMDANKRRNNQTYNDETEVPTLKYTRPNDTSYTLIRCWGLNNVVGKGLPQTKCSFLITDETAPRPPSACRAVKNENDITVTCDKGHDGGLQQKFKFNVFSSDSEEQTLSIINQEPKFIIPEPKVESYKFVVVAFNAKGESSTVEIDKDSIIDETEGEVGPVSSVSNITALALALCGGVLLLALAACGLVLCAHERGARHDLPRAHSDPPLCAYSTEDTNCETYHDSDEGSECNVRRTESFRRAISRYPSKNYDVRRTGSFHSARYLHELGEAGGLAGGQAGGRAGEGLRHSASCRMHSMQNVSRKRDMDALCDHLVMHLPPETNYNVAKPMNTFYTMPRKMRHKQAKELSDETSEITQTSDGFSLPPPPDEFGTYRAATKIKDMPNKSTPTYTTIVRKSPSGKELGKQQTISPNTIGLPTLSGAQNSLYTYPDYDSQGNTINTNPFDDSS
ncbi:Neural cell adhesion molecule 2 [Papilio machaon]|uniref:Neural cell adhesion molecule 2 n=1 Tax=Papilio machaon TaxID=76193 RepID=A0A194RCQ6_PAPMA|nr:Neural cell adhesion molecule 2 [Papilio machaon]